MADDEKSEGKQLAKEIIKVVKTRSLLHALACGSEILSDIYHASQEMRDTSKKTDEVFLYLMKYAIKHNDNKVKQVILFLFDLI